jgi:hypothetical protein
MHSGTRINYSSLYQWSYIYEAPGFQTAERTSDVVGNTIVFLPPIPPKVGDLVEPTDVKDLPFGTVLGNGGFKYLTLTGGRVISDIPDARAFEPTSDHYKIISFPS